MQKHRQRIKICSTPYFEVMENSCRRLPGILNCWVKGGGAIILIFIFPVGCPNQAYSSFLEGKEWRADLPSHPLSVEPLSLPPLPLSLAVHAHPEHSPAPHPSPWNPLISSPKHCYCHYLGCCWCMTLCFWHQQPTQNTKRLKHLCPLTTTENLGIPWSMFLEHVFGYEAGILVISYDF